MHVIPFRNKNRAINAVITHPNMFGPLLRLLSTFTFHVLLTTNVMERHGEYVCWALLQFACDTKSLAQCVAERQNTSAALVTPCLIRSLNVSIEGGLEICPSQGPSCPFPEVSPLSAATSPSARSPRNRSSRFHLKMSHLHSFF